MSKRYKKYDRFGGIEKVFYSLYSGDTTLTSIGKVVGYSKETVILDFLKHFGKEAYNTMKAKMRKRLEEVDLNLPNAIKSISKAMFKENSSLKCILNVLSKAKQADVPLVVTLSMPFTPNTRLKYRLINGRKVFIHTSFVHGNLVEHSIGLHRFKPRKVNADFYIFGICGKKGGIAYVFNIIDIMQIKSLNLRFENFEKKSKYDYARERWDILI